jgi:hypothetical protein
VSTITTSLPRALPAETASKLTAPGSPPSWLTISTLLRSAQIGELLLRRGPEGVGRRQQHRLAFVGQVLGQLADRGRLAGAVDARHHDHGGLVLADGERLLQRPQQAW